MGRRLKKYWLWLLILPAIAGLLMPGYFSVHDALHPAWVFEMYNALSSGQLPPRWAPDLSFGYGYPLFHFVYPLPYYLAAIFYALGSSLTFSVEAVTVLALAGSFGFMYLWAKELTRSKQAALVAALVYVYTPYRALDIYVRGALGETVGFAFLALLGFSISRLAKKTDLKNSLLVALGVASLTLSHNLMAYLGLIFFFFYSLVLMLIYKKGWRFLAWLTGGGVLGLLASAYFWLPALIDRGLFAEHTVFNFVDHFPFIYQLIIPSWGHGVSVWGPYDGLSFQIGLINLLVILTTVWLLIKAAMKRKWQRQYWLWLFVLTIFTGAGLMMNIRSMFVWETLPLGTYFQFPWRMLIVTTFTSALLAGLVVERLKLASWKLWLLAVLIIGVNLFYFVELDSPRTITDNQVFEEFFARNPVEGGEIYRRYLGNTEEYLRLPKAQAERPTTQREDKLESGEGLEIVEKERVSPIKWMVKTVGEGKLTVHVYSLPGWRAKINGQEVEVGIGEPWGQIEIEVTGAKGEDKGQERQIEVFYSQPESARVANWLSALALILGLGAWLYSQKRKKN